MEWAASSCVYERPSTFKAEPSPRFKLQGFKMSIMSTLTSAARIGLSTLIFSLRRIMAHLVSCAGKIGVSAFKFT